MIEIAEQHAHRAGASSIKCVTMKIGAFSGVMPEAMEFAFEVCSKGTLAEGARLEIIHVAARGRCHACTREGNLESLFDSCSECGSYALEILQGQEMAITEIEVD